MVLTLVDTPRNRFGGKFSFLRTQLGSIGFKLAFSKVSITCDIWIGKHQSSNASPLKHMHVTSEVSGQSLAMSEPGNPILLDMNGADSDCLFRSFHHLHRLTN